MARTCRYVEDGRAVHDTPATHVALGYAGRAMHWDVYDAVSYGSICVPEFCLGHAMDVAADRNRAAAARDAKREAR